VPDGGLQFQFSQVRAENKKAADESTAFVSGGGGGSRTRVQKYSMDSSTYLVLFFGFNPDNANAHAAAGRVTLV
jgi:hypothetical protein